MDLNFEDLLSFQQRGVKIPAEDLFNTDPLSWKASTGPTLSVMASAVKRPSTIISLTIPASLPSKNKLTKPERSRIYYLKNKEKIKLKRQEALSPSQREKARQRRENKFDSEFKMKRRKHRDENLASYLESERIYREQHRERLAAASRAYRARRKRINTERVESLLEK